MSRTITVSIPHRLTADEARARLQKGVGDLRTQFAGKVARVEERWTGNHADFQVGLMGQSVAGRLDIEEHVVRLEVDLPWLLAALAEKIAPAIRQQGARLLEKK